MTQHFSQTMCVQEKQKLNLFGVCVGAKLKEISFSAWQERAVGANQYYKVLLWAVGEEDTTRLAPIRRRWPQGRT